MPIDKNEIQRIRTTSIVEVAQHYGVKLTRQGNEWRACCPFHAEKTASFTVFPAKVGGQRFHCFGCSEHGDVIEFVSKVQGIGFRDAVSILGVNDTVQMKATFKQVSATVEDDYYSKLVPQLMVDHPFEVNKSHDLFNPKTGLTSKVRPELVHPYRDAGGNLLGVGLRLPISGKRKEVPIVRLSQRAWTRWRFDQPYPLYGLDRLAAHPAGKQVIVVEGEKCADWLHERIGERFPIVSWPGGAGAVKHVDLSPLTGRKLILWADHDEPGSKAMALVAETLKPALCKVIDTWAADPTIHEKEGWDCADLEDGDPVAYMKANAVEWGEAGPAKAEVPATPVAAPTPKPPAPSAAGLESLPADRATPWPEARDMIFDKDGINQKATRNWANILTYSPWWKGVFRLNFFTQKIDVVRCPPWVVDPIERKRWRPRERRDTDILEAVGWFEWYWNSSVMKSSPLLEAINLAATKAAYDPLKEYVDGLAWDGVPRIDGWLARYAGCEDTPYATLVGSLFLVSGIARALQPGAKVDTMLVLEGGQGAKKSTVWKALFGDDWFTDTMPAIEDKDAKLQLKGKWCVEFAEMHRIGKSTNDAVKSFLSVDRDEYRPPYGKDQVDVKRRVVFVGTVNPDGSGYLNDPTGSRRFWPVKVFRAADLEAIRRDRDQIWAEARERFYETRKWWVDEVSEENLTLIKPQQKKRFEPDAWAAIIKSRISEVPNGTIELPRIYLDWLSLTNKEVNAGVKKRIVTVMSQLGWERGEGDVMHKREPRH